MSSVDIKIVETQPLPLTGKAQSYAWGKIGKNSKVAQLMAGVKTFAVDESKPYAELWMGTHPNAPSTLSINGKDVLLKDVLSEKILSKEIHSEYKADLPFLFKILSINKALSIQAHPDKKLAQKLFDERPDIYKDPNHKPEMCVALTPFEAFLKFRPLEEIANHLKQYPALKNMVGDVIATKFIDRAQKFGSTTIQSEIQENKRVLQELFDKISRATDESIKKNVTDLITSVENKQEKNILDDLLLRLNKEYPNDIGIFCAFLLNYVKLNAGEAIFLAANEPHAYLYGDCVECMAASDNVVRSGLTPKYRDVDTLVSMLTYNYGPADKQKLSPESGFLGLKKSILYDPPIDEFSVLLTNLDNAGDSEAIPGINGPSILIVTSGSGKLNFTAGGKPIDNEITAGSVYFIGAGVPIKLSSNSSDFVVYRAFCTISK